MTHPGRLRDRVAAAVREHELWSPGERVAVAVSGGLDSVCLLDLLLRTVGLHGAQLCVASVDHGTREGSAADLDLVRRLAERYGLTLHETTLSLGEHASEQVCREARYAFLDTIDVDRVALAHHLDDQTETLLLQLLRGAGSRGLGGMAPRRGRYVRPLLGVRRHELTTWADHRGLAWRDDPSNADPRYLRNRVRAELVPILQTLRPGAVPNVSRAALRCAEDDALLNRLAKEQPHFQPTQEGWPLDWVRDGPRPLVRRALLAGLPGAGSAHIDAILRAVKQGRGLVHLPGAVSVRINAPWVCLPCVVQAHPLATGPAIASDATRAISEGSERNEEPLP